MAGSSYSLFCDVRITLNVNRVSLPNITWSKYSVGVIQEGPGESELLFSPLTPEDKGLYFCTAKYSVGGVASPSSQSSNIEVSVSKSLCLYIVDLFMLLKRSLL